MTTSGRCFRVWKFQLFVSLLHFHSHTLPWSLSFVMISHSRHEQQTWHKNLCLFRYYWKRRVSQSERKTTECYDIHHFLSPLIHDNLNFCLQEQRVIMSRQLFTRQSLTFPCTSHPLVKISSGKCSRFNHQDSTILILFSLDRICFLIKNAKCLEPKTQLLKTDTVAEHLLGIFCNHV